MINNTEIASIMTRRRAITLRDKCYKAVMSHISCFKIQKVHLHGKAQYKFILLQWRKCFLLTVVVSVKASTVVKTALSCKTASVPLPHWDYRSSAVIMLNTWVSLQEAGKIRRGVLQENQSVYPSNSQECHLVINPASLWFFSIWRNY